MKNQGVTGVLGSIGRFRTALVLVGAVLGTACASAPPQAEIPSAESYYRKGLEVLKGQRILLFFRDTDYALAIEMFREVIDNYPYSDYSTLAELKIADVYFEQEHYEEAAEYYQDFVELHPTHPQVPYSIYRNGLCSYEQMRAIDQDQTPTQEALAQFRVLLERYPHSEYTEDAQRLISVAEDHLSAHVREIGDFYFAQGAYYGAAERYEEALEDFPKHSERDDTLYHLAVCYHHLKRDPDAAQLLSEIISMDPRSDWADDAEDLLQDINGAAKVDLRP
ncbi:MAG: outer membrane protein assembly factor BamD [Myxococcota bacterium]